MLFQRRTDHWNLDLFFLDKKPFSGFMDYVNLMLEKIKLLDAPETVLAHQITLYEELDLFVDSLESLLFLMKQENVNKDLQIYDDVLHKISYELTVHVPFFFSRLRSVPIDSLPFWGRNLKVMIEMDLDSDSYVPYPLLSNEENIDKFKQLQDRILKDKVEENDFPKSLNLRIEMIKQWPCLIDSIASKRFFIDSHNYFNSIIPLTCQQSSLSLTNIRDIQREPWSRLHFTYIDAIQYIEAYFSNYCIDFKGLVKKAFDDGRIRFLSRKNAPSFCLDTPKGSYIQVFFTGDLESLALLAHECGHLIHQEMVRRKFVLKQEISGYQSELIALYFENHIVECVLQEMGHNRVYDTWMNRQYNEWVNWHMLLTIFELELYHLSSINRSSVAKLWMKLNQQFYPSYTDFYNGFCYEGEHSFHLFQIPFYTLVYPSAYLHSLLLDDSDVINMIMSP